MAKRLTQHHPTDKKLRLLENFMREYKIYIDYSYGFHFIDEENNVSAKYKSEDSQDSSLFPEHWDGSYLVIEE